MPVLSKAYGLEYVVLSVPAVSGRDFVFVQVSALDELLCHVQGLRVVYDRFQDQRGYVPERFLFSDDLRYPRLSQEGLCYLVDYPVYLAQLLGAELGAYVLPAQPEPRLRYAVWTAPPSTSINFSAIILP